jgi:carboxymethylenebutenolidase
MTTIQIETPDGPIDALLNIPPGDGPGPGVVVIHDAIGYGPDKASVNERIAGAGYVAITPNLYARGGRIRCISRVMRELLTQRGRALDDILAARDHLRALPQCSGQVGIAGFCMGGRFALVMSPKGFGASAPFYGTPLPRNLSATLDGACPIVASFGGRDLMGKGAPELLREVTASKNIAADIKVYPRAGHGFANELPAQPLLRIAGFGHDQSASDDAWRRVFAFFGEHLGAGTTS